MTRLPLTQIDLQLAEARAQLVEHEAALAGLAPELAQRQASVAELESQYDAFHAAASEAMVQIHRLTAPRYTSDGDRLIVPQQGRGRDRVDDLRKQARPYQDAAENLREPLLAARVAVNRVERHMGALRPGVSILSQRIARLEEERAPAEAAQVVQRGLLASVRARLSTAPV